VVDEPPDELHACLARLGFQDRRIVELVEEIEQLHAAEEHRYVIEQAKGVIMGAVHCSATTAFAILVAQSQFQNRKVRDIAEEIAADQDR
jgi:AmiR/NasT family two-component response regulator